MKASATLLFWAGCVVIIICAVIQLVFPNLLTPFFIIVAVVFCIRQWNRKVHEMQNILAEEQEARRAANQYISTLTQSKKKR